MNDTTKATFERAAAIKLQIKSLEEEYDMIQPTILKETVAFFNENKSNPEVTGKGSFAVYLKKNWVYSEFVKTSEHSLKERKKEEEKNGEATFTETEVLKFNTIKE